MKPLWLPIMLLGLLASPVSAQEPPKFPGPQKEHEVLKQFAGDWETDSEAEAGPGKPAMKCKGRIHSKMLGGFWVVSELETEMMGTKVVGVQTIGYDPKTQKYVGTWVDSVMNHMWKYEGSLDKTGKILTLEAEGPTFLGDGKTAKFRDVYEFKTNDLIGMSSMIEDENGKWITFMTGTARRKK